MNRSIFFSRALSSTIITIFITSYFSYIRPCFEGIFSINIILAFLLSALFCSILIAIDAKFRKMHLKMFNTLILGIFSGLILGKCFISIFDTLLIMANIGVSNTFFMVIILKAFIYLIGIHLGTTLTFAYAEQFHICLPFIRFGEVIHGKKDLIIDESFLADPRAIDFLSTGILNDRLTIPLFIIKSLIDNLESSEEYIKLNARKLLLVIEKMKEMKSLGLKEYQGDFLDLSDNRKKILKLAKLTKSTILVADSSKVNAQEKDLYYVALNHIALSLKNSLSSGELFSIKVQRYGKEANQGVGYLDDGTMVVVNGGGSFIGEVIETQVISVKQTSAGRIIFTNTLIEDEQGQKYLYEPSLEYAHHQD